MEIITGVVVFITEARKAIVRPIGTHFGYLIQYDVNVRALEEQAKKLLDQQVDLQQSVEADARNGKDILPSVKTWLNAVDETNAGLKNFLEEHTKANPRCLKGWCPNLKERYSLSKKAKDKFEEVAELQKEGKFERISTPAAPPKMGPIFADVKGFESRMRIINEVLHSLREDKISMIGICGMGGVGKTTMVKEVIKIVETEKMFKEVAMAVVSQPLDPRRIQGEIADRLGLKFDVESVRGRAEKLHERLMRSESVLIILDDVWGELDLEEIGIPSRNNHKAYKIILTTRSKDVLTKMESQKDFTVSILSEGEAWDLFMEAAGNSTKQSDLLPTAKEVAKECGGLPLAIVIVGKALRGKIKEQWLDARYQLRKSSLSSFKEMNESVFSRIKFSYNFLGNEEHKSCFLLCCLFPEDFDIPVEYLVRHCVGLSYFKDIDSLYDARNRVYAIIDKLKSLFLLLDSDKEGYVKLHDVVRDVAISIVSEGERVFLVRHDDQLTKWPSEDTCKHCTAISLSCGQIKEYPDAVECPKLELLHLMHQYHLGIGKAPFSLLEGTKKLKILAIGNFIIGRHPSSLEVLKNLQHLGMHDCELDNLCFLGALKSLQILSLVDSRIGEFSQELGQLRHLKLLDLTRARCRILPGILSNLSQLEELRLMHLKWQSMQQELKSLSHLKILFIHIPDAILLPKKLLFDDLRRFWISIGFQGNDHKQFLINWRMFWKPTGFQNYGIDSFYPIPNCLTVQGDLRLIIESGINQLSKKTELLELNDVDNLKNGLHELEGQGFPCLNSLILQSCCDLEYIIDAEDYASHTSFPILESLYLSSLDSLTEICHGQVPREQELIARLPFFGNLRHLKIFYCPQLENVIPLSIARGLVQLQHFEVHSCPKVEDIVFSLEENQDGIAFPQLAHLELSDLPELSSFYNIRDDTLPEDPSLNHQVKSLDSLGLSRHDQFEVGSSSSQPKLHLVHNLHILLDSQWISRLPNLKELVMHRNESLDVVFDLGGLSHVEEDRRIEMLAHLTEVDLFDLSKLTSIWKNVPNGFQGLGNLQELRVKECCNLTQLFPPSIAKLLVKLQQVEIGNCSMLESILAIETEGGKEACNLEWPSLKELFVDRCEKLKTFGSTIQSPRKVKRINDARTTNDSHLARRNASQWSHTVCPCLRPKLKSEQSEKHEDSNLDDLTSKNEATMSGLQDSNHTKTSNMEEIYSFFPSSLIHGVQNLQNLQLDFCASIKVIFDLLGLDEEENHLNALERMTLTNLSKLMHIWKVGPKDIRGFQNLKHLNIEGCNSLRNFIPLSIAKFLMKLETIEIDGCGLMEEIIAEGVEEEKIDEIAFPKLNCIILQNLPNLASFYLGACNIEFPFLAEMRVVGCVKLKTFVLSNIATPKLQKVCIEHADYPLMGDLNKTIQNIFDRQRKV